MNKTNQQKPRVKCNVLSHDYTLYRDECPDCKRNHTMNKTKQQTAYFERFTLDLPDDAVTDCSHPGACDDDVEFWATKIQRPPEITPESLRAELKEHGAWDSTELADDEQNWQRLIWIASGNIREENNQ